MLGKPSSDWIFMILRKNNKHIVLSYNADEDMTDMSKRVKTSQSSILDSFLALFIAAR